MRWIELEWNGMAWYRNDNVIWMLVNAAAYVAFSVTVL